MFLFPESKPSLANSLANVQSLSGHAQVLNKQEVVNSAKSLEFSD